MMLRLVVFFCLAWAGLAQAKIVMIECDTQTEISDQRTKSITEKKSVIQITFDSDSEKVLKFTSFLLPSCTSPDVKNSECQCVITEDAINCKGIGVFDLKFPAKTRGQFTVNRMSGSLTGQVTNQFDKGEENFFFDGTCKKLHLKKF
jgi:hypothetical protein